MYLLCILKLAIIFWIRNHPHVMGYNLYYFALYNVHATYLCSDCIRYFLKSATLRIFQFVVVFLTSDSELDPIQERWSICEGHENRFTRVDWNKSAAISTTQTTEMIIVLSNRNTNYCITHYLHNKYSLVNTMIHINVVGQVMSCQLQISGH